MSIFSYSGRNNMRKRYWIKFPTESDKNENETKKFKTMEKCKIAIKH